MRALFGFAAIFFGLTTAAIASPTIDTLAVQGYMKRANGTAVTDGTYNLAFGVFQNGVAIWGTQAAVTITNGLFSKNLSGVGSNLSSLSAGTGMNSNFSAFTLNPALLNSAGSGSVMVRVYAIDPINGSQPQFDITMSSVPTAYVAGVAQSVANGSVTLSGLASSARVVTSSGTATDSGKLVALDSNGVLDTSVLPTIPSANITALSGLTGVVNSSASGAANAPAMRLTGSPYTAGTSTTNKAMFLLEDAASSAGWSTAGTYLGINAAAGFSGNLIDLQSNGSSRFRVSSTGALTATSASIASTDAASTANILGVSSNTTGAQVNGIARLSFTGAHTGNGLQIDDVTATGTVASIEGSAITTGSILSVSSTNATSTGNAFVVSSNSTGAQSNGIARLNFTGAHTGNGLQIDDATQTGTVAAVSASALTTGSILSISSTNAASTGNAFLVSSNSTGAQVNGIARFNFSGAHTANGLQIDDATATGNAVVINANSATTGRALSVSGNALTSGNLINVASTSTAAASNTQTLLNLDLSGTNGTAGQTTYGMRIANTHAGATSTNVGLSVSASGGTTANYAAIFTNGNVGVGSSTPATRLTVTGPIALNPPTSHSSAYTVAANDSSLIIHTANVVLTLPAAASFPGRVLFVKTRTAHSATSASSNVVPLNSATAGTAILAATAGRWAILQSDGTNWVIMAAN